MESATPDTCAACGKEGDSLKACTACNMVKYCNRDCQISHRSKHKKACKKRASEIYDEKLFKDHTHEECPICLLPFPVDNNTASFKSCCGKTICDGCIYAMAVSEGKDLCPFCRTLQVSSVEEEIIGFKKLMEKGNAEAHNQIGAYYARGMYGFPLDRAKALELFLKAGELGCESGYHHLGNAYYHGRGVEVNMKKAKHYMGLAAIMGGGVNALHSRNNLGSIEGRAGNHHRAMKHMIIAAKAGFKLSLESVEGGFKAGVVPKDEYANTLRSYQKSNNEMKSDMRDKAAALHLDVLSEPR